MSNHIERTPLSIVMDKATLERRAKMKMLVNSFTAFYENLIDNKRARSFSVTPTIFGIYFRLRSDDPKKVLIGTIRFLIESESLSAHVIECSPEQVPPGRINIAEVINSTDSESPKPKVILNERSVTKREFADVIKDYLPLPQGNPPRSA